MPPDENELGDLTKEDLERRKMALEIQLTQHELKQKKSLVTVVVSFLGVLGAVSAIFVGITSAVGNVRNTGKTSPEIAQILEGQKRAAQANDLANVLSAKSKESPEAFQQSIAENSKELQEAVASLQQIQVQATRVNVQRSVLKFILLWILFYVTGLVFDVVGQAWNTATSTLMNGISAWTWSKAFPSATGDPVQADRWRRRMNSYVRITPIASNILQLLPNILRWSLQLSIFSILLGPLFDEIAASLGTTITFAAVLQEARHLHFARMLSLMQQALFTVHGSGTG